MVVQLRAFTSRQPGIGVELVRALDALACLQDLPVLALGHVDGRLGVAAVEDRKGVEAQFAQPRRGRRDRGLAAGEVLRAVLEGGGGAVGNGRRGRSRLGRPHGGWRDPAAGGL